MTVVCYNIVYLWKHLEYRKRSVMKKSQVYLIIQTVVCIALVALMSVSAVSIYREGVARKAQNPLESIYTPEIVAQRFAPIAPLFIAALVLLVVGLAMGLKDEEAEKPVKDAELARDLVANRVVQPSEAMLRERATQKRLTWIGWGVFALCMVPIAIYMTKPEHFPQELEDMFYALIRVFLPCAAVGLGALTVTAALREKSVMRETEAAKTRLQEEKAAGVTGAPAPVVQAKGRAGVQAVVIVVAVALIIAGIFNGSARDVLIKAITICTECVGLG